MWNIRVTYTIPNRERSQSIPSNAAYASESVAFLAKFNRFGQIGVPKVDIRGSHVIKFLIREGVLELFGVDGVREVNEGRLACPL